MTTQTCLEHGKPEFTKADKYGYYCIECGAPVEGYDYLAVIPIPAEPVKEDPPPFVKVSAHKGWNLTLGGIPCKKN